MRAIGIVLPCLFVAACSGSDFGVANAGDSGADTLGDSTTDTSSGDAPTDTHADGAGDVVDGAAKCPTGALSRVTGPFAVGDTPGPIAAGDLNKDGHADLVVADGSGMVTVLLGVGDGTFSTRYDFAAGDHPSDVDLGDVNGDGELDVVVTATGLHEVRLLAGVGDGRLRPEATMATLDTPLSSTLSNLDDDTKLDLATVDGATNQLEIFAGNGDGTVASTPTKTVSVGLGPLVVAAKKLGSTAVAPIDLVVAAANADTIDVVHGPGFVAAIPFSGVTQPYAISFGDFNVDGRTDIAAADHLDGKAFVLLADGTGAYAVSSTPALDMPLAIATADLDADGHDDLFVGSALDVVYLSGTTSGAFGAATSMKVAGAGLVAVDIDGDGNLDVAATDPTGSVHVIVSCAH